MAANRKPLVAVLMGSDSDLPTMREVGEMLKKFDVPYVMRVTSAHRSPRATHAMAETLESEGIQVFVVGAGLAAHLAGAIAAVTTLPVIGVPMEGGSLRGVDALYSTVQMPSGVPVATMSIGRHGAKNAGILAAQILALGDPALKERLKVYKAELEQSVTEKDRAVASEFETTAEAIRELTKEGDQ
ncbi:MAG: 5-(carboxyamino)imidazole ribonucleotide mutase [Candidatus Eisenbacteria bacterium]|nr:5-(carboxyamino)imidazole ribonucleotide mutase [Candidatus Eisenbacteria bacterium]